MPRGPHVVGALIGIGLVALGVAVGSLAFIGEPPSGWLASLALDVVWLGVGIGVAVAGVRVFRSAIRPSPRPPRPIHHECRLCGRRFDSRGELDAHLSDHGEIKRPTLIP